MEGGRPSLSSVSPGRSNVSPYGGILWSVSIGAALGVVLAALNIAGGSTSFGGGVAGYIAVAIAISFLCRGADRLWSFTVAGMLRSPLSWFGIVTRVPFWSFAGGVGLTLGLLLLKKFRLHGRHAGRFDDDE